MINGECRVRRLRPSGQADDDEEKTFFGCFSGRNTGYIESENGYRISEPYMKTMEAVYHE